MEVLYAICCGLDVHKASIIACLRPPGVGAQRTRRCVPPRYGLTAVPCALVLLVWTAQRRPALLAIAGIAVLAFYWQVSAWDRIDVILAQLDGWS
jgi:hypothetical protein